MATGAVNSNSTKRRTRSPRTKKLQMHMNDISEDDFHEDDYSDMYSHMNSMNTKNDEQIDFLPKVTLTSAKISSTSLGATASLYVLSLLKRLLSTQAVSVALRSSLATRISAISGVFTRYMFNESLVSSRSVIHRLPSRKKTLVLDLDETLIHSTTRPANGFGLTVELFIDKQSCVFYVFKRAHVDEFLSRVAQWFNVIIFTASMPAYADPVIDWLDPTRVIIQKRYFRDSCTFMEGNFLKNLTIIEPDLSHVMIVDNSPIAYTLQPDNAIPIEGWMNSGYDTGLLDLLPMLDAMRYVDDVRHILSLRRCFMSSF